MENVDGTGQRPILIAYDGSAGADAAIEEAGALFPGRPARVASIWRSVREAARAGRLALPDDVVNVAVANLDAAAYDDALHVATGGVDRARAAGLADPAPVAEAAEPSVAATLLRLAESHDVAAVVIGSRGRSGVRAALLGSVSTAVVQRCRRPVLVVHHPDQPAIEAQPEPSALP